MSKFLIVGAGQAGLQLALGLVQDGHDVTVVSNRTPDDIRNGRVMSSQCMFGAALEHERELGINHWEAECPDIEGISLAVPAPGGGKMVDFAARLDRPAQSVDQRLKMPAWMEELEKQGGKVVLHDAGIPTSRATRATTTWSSSPPARATLRSCSSATLLARRTARRSVLSRSRT